MEMLSLATIIIKLILSCLVEFIEIALLQNKYGAVLV